MSRVQMLVLIGALAGFVAGCARCDEDSAESAPRGEVSTPTTTGRPEPVGPAPTVEQLPLPQDFAQHAGQRVTDETYLEELARIETEVGPIPERPAAPVESTPAGGRGMR